MKVESTIPRLREREFESDMEVYGMDTMSDG